MRCKMVVKITDLGLIALASTHGNCNFTFGKLAERLLTLCDQPCSYSIRYNSTRARKMV